MKIRTSKYKKITKKQKKIQLKIRTESKTKTKLNKKMKIKLLKKTHCGSKLPLKNKNWHEKKKEKKYIYGPVFIPVQNSHKDFTYDGMERSTCRNLQYCTITKVFADV